MAGIGIAAVVASFALLFSVAPPAQIFLSGLALMALAAGLNMLSASMMLFSLTGAIGVPLLLMLGAAILMIGTGIGIAAGGMSMMVDSVAAMAGLGAAGAAALREMAEAINEVDTEKAIEFRMTMAESARFVEAISAMGTAPNQSVAFMGGGGGGGGGSPIINVTSEIKGDMRKLFDVIDSRIAEKVNRG